MSCLWISLSVLCAASVLQSSASPNKEMSNPAVSLKCNQTVGVTAGELVTLTCVMLQWNHSTLEDCEGELYSWRNTRGEIPCNNGSMKYNCEWDNLTYVSLTISNVMEDDNYKITILMTCGLAESSIKVQVKPNTNGTLGKPQDPEEDTNPYVTAVMVTIFSTLFVFGIMILVFGTGRGREIIKHAKKEKTQGDPSGADPAGGGLDCLIHSEI